MGVYGELVFIEFYLCVFIYPSNLSIKKFAIMMTAILYGDFPGMHRDDRDIDRLHQRLHMSMWCLTENLSISVSSLCIQGKSPCSTAAIVIANFFIDKLLVYIATFLKMGIKNAHRGNFENVRIFKFFLSV